MEAQAIDPSEYPTAILGVLEAMPGTTGADNPEEVDTTDLFNFGCRFLPDTGHRVKHVASVAVAVATGKLSQPPLLPALGSVTMSRDASWVGEKYPTVRGTMWCKIENI